MKILHTADWHLGRSLCGVSLLREQEEALLQLLDHAETERPDLLIVAGDVYDRAIPPVEAMELLDRTLGTLTEDLQVPVLLISGNHDNARRLGFGSRFFRSNRVGIYLCCDLAASTKPILFQKGGTTAAIYAFPYHEPAEARAALSNEEIHSHEAAMAGLCGALTEAPADAVRIGVAHSFVAGGTESESERPLSVGGVATVPHSVFDAFTYVALGHLHAPQHIGREAVRYSGSLYKFSFSEEKHQKSATLLHLEKGQLASLEILPLKPARDLRTVEGTFDELQAAAGEMEESRRHDYLRVRLMDAVPIMDARDRLVHFYPNILEISRPLLEKTGSTIDIGERKRLEELKPEDHFEQFFSYVTGGDLTDDQRTLLHDVVRDVIARAEEESA